MATVQLVVSFPPFLKGFPKAFLAPIVILSGEKPDFVTPPVTQML